MAYLVVLVVIDIAYVVLSALVIGIIAPRLPNIWFDGDYAVLHLLPFEDQSFYRRVGAARLARRLPEAGGTFGGESKSALPGTDHQSLLRYLREVRRAEWVHWLSTLASFALFAFNPWWLALAFVLVVFLVNLTFIIVLRHNRLRIQRVLRRSAP